MIQIGILAAIAVALGILNRLRGTSGWMPSWLPGRALIYVAPAVGLLTWAVLPWPFALAFGLGFLLWGSIAWGHLYDFVRPIGRLSWDKPEPIERVLLAVSFGWKPLAFFLRHAIFALPLTATVAWLLTFPLLAVAAIPFAFAAVLSYALAQILRPADWNPAAEVATGALAWGGLLALVQTFAS